METTAPPPSKPFRFLELPTEIRVRIYDEVFADSTVRTECYDQCDVRSWRSDFKNYHSAISQTSRFIRSECVEILYRTTTLVICHFNWDPTEDLNSIMSAVSPILLERVQTLRLVTNFTPRYPYLSDMIRSLPNIKVVESCLKLAMLVDDFFDVKQYFQGSFTHQFFGELAHLSNPPNLSGLYDQLTEVGKHSSKQFSVFAQPLVHDLYQWILSRHQLTTLSVDILLIGEYFERTIDGPQTFWEFATSIRDKYPVVYYDGRTLRSREVQEEDLTRLDRDTLLREFKNSK